MNLALGTLYIVATPIGHLGDMSPRAISVLKEVDCIAAEDTRHSRVLLQHFAIETPMVSLHEHNEKARVPLLIQRIQKGESIALISDAGTPLISDPGYHLVQAAHDVHIKIVPIPGPCALISALCISGLPSDRFVFEGFLPSRSHPRCERLTFLKKEPRTLIFYESPHRIASTLTDMANILGGERMAVLAREMTKSFETIYRAPLGELKDKLSADHQRGEFVIVVQGAEELIAPEENETSIREILDILLEALPVKQAVHLACKITKEKKNRLYAMAIEKDTK